MRPQFIGLSIMVVAALGTRLPFFGHPAVEFDEQLYSLIGARMNHGLLPYADLWDRKPIGLFLIFAFTHGLGGDGPLPYQLLSLLACLAGGWQVWRLGRRIAEPGTAALGSAFYPVLLALLSSHSGQSEVFLIPLAMAIAQLLLAAADRPLATARRYCLAAMLCGGLALQVKYTVAAQCLFFGVCALLLLRRKGRTSAGLVGDAAIFAAIGLFPTLLAAARYGHLGLLDEFVFANFQSIGLRAPMPFGRFFYDKLPQAIPLLALAGGGIAAVRMREPRTPAPLWSLALAWFGATAVGLLTLSTIYYHNYAALAPSAILAALPMFDRRRARIAIWPVFFFGMLGGAIFLNRPFDAARNREVLSGMARDLRPFVGRRSHCLYVFDGPTALYRLTGSGLPSRIVYPDHLNNALEEHALPVDQMEELARILAERPGAIVTSSDPVSVQNPAANAAVARELALHYRLLGQRVFDGRRLNLHARLPDADGVAPPCRLR